MIHTIVTSGEPPTRSVIAAHAAALEIPGTDQEAVVSVTLTLLLALHEGNTRRYGIKVDDFSQWKNALTHST